MIPLTPIRRRIQELWDSGLRPFDIAEQTGESVDNVRLSLYGYGLSFQQVRERDRVFIEKTCVQCGRTYKQVKPTHAGRWGKAGPENYCSVTCIAAATAAIKQARPPLSAERKRSVAIILANQARAAANDHRRFMNTLNIKKAIRAHDDAEADRAVKRP